MWYIYIYGHIWTYHLGYIYWWYSLWDSLSKKIRREWDWILKKKVGIMGDSVMRGENGIYKQYTVMGCCWWDTMRSDIVVYRNGIFWKMLEYITKLWYLGPPEIFLIHSPGRKLWMIDPHFGPTDPQSHIINHMWLSWNMLLYPQEFPCWLEKKSKNHWIFDNFLPHGPTLEAWKTS